MHGIKQEISRRNFKAGYIVIRAIVDGSEYGGEDFEMTWAETPDGVYIGDSKWAYRLCKKRGIKPQKRTPNSSVCSVGFCEKEQKWYGWSHRAICGFGIGDIVEEGDCTATSGWTDDYLAEHPEADISLPVGFKAKCLEDARKMANAFAESVS